MMRLLQILLFVLLVFVFETSAQLCGKYGITLRIKDEVGKPAANPKIEITSLQEKNDVGANNFVRESDSSADYRIAFSEGYQVRGKYRVVVAADGYAPAQKELIFPHCSRLKYEVVLKPRRVQSASFFRELVEIRGELWTDKKRNGSVNLTATGDAGRIYRTKAGEDGIYLLDLPLGKYTLLYEKAGYETVKVENTKIEEFKNIYIYNVELKFLGTGKRNTVVKDFKDLYTSFNL